MVRVGCCGWAQAQHRYVAVLDAVEVQQTFYQPPRPETLQRWRQAAPAHFAFSVKCFQIVTHERTSPTYRRLRRPLPAGAVVGHLRDSPWVRAAWEETVNCARILRAHWILVQTPPSFTPEPEHQRALERFASVASSAGIRIAFEPRGGAWQRVDLDHLCSALGWWWVCDPLAATTARLPAGDIAYFRLHGPQSREPRYGDAELLALRSMTARYAESWVFFNHRAMWDDACRFRALLAGEAAPRSRGR